MAIAEALAEIRTRIRRAVSAEHNVLLVAVSKTFGADQIRQAYDLGLRDFGENKVQELLEKKQSLPDDVRWHMIGRLQTNKVKDVLGHVALIHSLDRIELFEKIEAEAKKSKISSVECLLQVNVSGEASKAGFSADAVEPFLSRVSEDSPVKIKGLMTMAPWTDDPEKIRHVFRATRVLFDKLKQKQQRFEWRYLSMGMSGDFEVAVEEGANLVRIGTALFGARKPE